MPKVDGAINIAPEECPSFVVIGYRSINEVFFGGTIISDRWILTAAHIIKSFEMFNATLKEDKKLELIIMTAYEYITTKSSKYKVKALYVNPKYSIGSLDHDVGLVKIEGQFKFNKYVAPMSLPNNNIHLNSSKGAVVGFGFYFNHTSKVLKKQTVNIYGPTYAFNCFIRTQFQYDPKMMICAGAAKDGIDMFLGDSGGPLIVKQDDEKQIVLGITAPFAKLVSNCDTKHGLNLFTLIYPYMDWIKQIIATNS